MSEFKFACPVCGQHITADSNAAGSQLSCPTCFRKIVVPQAPSSTDPKFILSAAEVNKPRLPKTNGPAPTETATASAGRKWVPAAVVGGLILVGAAGAAVFLLRDKILNKSPGPAEIASDPSAGMQSDLGEVPPPAGTNKTVWTLDLSRAVIPTEAASGKIRGRDFACGRAILDGGTLTLRHGNTSTTDLGLNIYLAAKQPQELTGRSVSVAPQTGTAPWVVVRWKEGPTPKQETIKTGYALKLEFGNLSGGRLPGKIYVCLPDETKSCVAGTFTAEVRNPAPSPTGGPRAAN